ncbi:hypothetical protein ACWGBV_00815 [Streptomyces sp. NPDC055051]
MAGRSGAGPSPLAGTHILLGERDAETAARSTRALREHGASSVLAVDSPEAFLHAGAAPPDPVRFWDAAVWHTGFGGDDGSLGRFLEKWRAQHPGIPVVVTDDAPSARLAVAALRGRAADLVERSDPEGLAAAVARAVAERADPLGVEGTGQGSLRMLVVGAHPDDVEIGLGRPAPGRRPSRAQ